MADSNHGGKPLSGNAGVVRLDAHLHLWELSAGAYSWLSPQYGPLYDTFTAEQAHETLAEAGISAAVLVQADDTATDTRAMLAAARSNDFIVGVVGWLPLEDPRAAEALLGTWLESPKFCGVRTLIHDDPRPDVLKFPAVRRSLAMLAEVGVPFDVPDAFPRHLGQVAALASGIPSLTVILDHLGKPPRSGTFEEFALWERQLRAVAALPNTVAKVSGLHCAGAPFTADALARVWDIALDAFGPQRLMFGGDWPVSLLGGPYGQLVQTVGGLIDSLSPSEASALWSGTADRVYSR